MADIVWQSESGKYRVVRYDNTTSGTQYAVERRGRPMLWFPDEQSAITTAQQMEG